MPLYMDRHDVPGATPKDVAEAHLSDLEVADGFDVDFLSYWYDSADDAVFCFARAPAPENMESVHRASHGLIPSEIIEVSEGDVVRFLGKVHHPADQSEMTSPFRTIIFTDIEGSTALLEAVGQIEFMTLLSEHDLIIRRLLLTWRGREVKHTGDGFLLSFDDLADGLRCCLAIDRAFEERWHQASEPVKVRIGMAAGEPVDHDDDIFGAAVNLADRICSAAQPGHPLVSENVYELGSERGFDFGPGVEMEMKGFSDPAVVHELIAPPPGDD